MKEGQEQEKLGVGKVGQHKCRNEKAVHGPCHVEDGPGSTAMSDGSALTSSVLKMRIGPSRVQYEK